MTSMEAFPVLIELTPHHDPRGYFVETFHQERLGAITGPDFAFVQDNVSVSNLWVLRGLHYQLPPHQQGKLVRVAHGAVYDVVVDVRRSSPTFGRWWGRELSDSAFTELWVPPGFAHGFLSLADETQVLYKVTAHHAPSTERVIRWDDVAIGIDWPLHGIVPVLSIRDRDAPTLAEAEVFD
jgi:dTDP-4-dehydrorhamnose 3,5-epimerase